MLTTKNCEMECGQFVCKVKDDEHGFVHPFDCMKTRMQLSQEMARTSGLKPYSSVFDCFKTTLKEEGPRGLYSGLSAGLMRQGTYSTMRLGLYQTFRAKWKEAGYSSNFLSMFCLGGMAGGISAFCTNPVEVALIRMQADGRLPVAERRGYSNVLNAISRVASEEGVLSLWNGVTPTVTRAIVVNSVQMATYDRTKQLLNAYGVDGFAAFFLASLNAGFLYSLATLPLDISKTRMYMILFFDSFQNIIFLTNVSVSTMFS